MNGPIWIGWAVVVLLAAISILLLLGKGSSLIAGYNTASKEEKEKFNTNRLCRTVGGGFSLITVIVALEMFFEGNLPKYLQWIMPWGFLCILALMIVLSNTICRNK